MAFDLTQRPFENHPDFRKKKKEKPCCAQRRALLKEVKELREALEFIAAEDVLLNANPKVFGEAAARRMQAQAQAALDTIPKSKR